MYENHVPVISAGMRQCPDIFARFTYDGGSAQEIADMIERAQLRAHDMPIGWSSYWSAARTVFKCGCTRGTLKTK